MGLGASASSRAGEIAGSSAPVAAPRGPLLGSSRARRRRIGWRTKSAIMPRRPAASEPMRRRDATAAAAVVRRGARVCRVGKTPPVPVAPPEVGTPRSWWPRPRERFRRSRFRCFRSRRPAGRPALPGTRRSRGCRPCRGRPPEPELPPVAAPPAGARRAALGGAAGRRPACRHAAGRHAAGRHAARRGPAAAPSPVPHRRSCCRRWHHRLPGRLAARPPRWHHRWQTPGAAAALGDLRIGGTDLIETQERDDVVGVEDRVGRAVVAAERGERVEDHVAARVLPALTGGLVSSELDRVRRRGGELSRDGGPLVDGLGVLA
jgi:hypothetical protein